MPDNRNLHQSAGISVRPWLLAPVQQYDWFVDITDLETYEQGNTDTGIFTRRYIDCFGPGTDQHQVTVGDGVVSVIFEIDKNGVPLDGGGNANVDCNALTTNEEVAEALRVAILNSAIRDTVLIQRIGNRLILRNAYAAATDDITVASSDASFTVGTYLQFVPFQFKYGTPEVPNYCPVAAVMSRGGEADDILQTARVVVYGLDLFDNPVSSEVLVRSNGNAPVHAHTFEVFARVDEIRIYDFASGEGDRLRVGYAVPYSVPLLDPLVDPTLQELAGYTGAWEPFVHATPVTQPDNILQYRDTGGSGILTEHRYGGVRITLDTTGLDAVNVADGDILHIGDGEEEITLTFAAAPAASTDIPIGGSADVIANSVITALADPANASRFSGERISFIPAAYGEVYISGGNREMFVEMYRPEAGPDPFASVIADTDYEPKRFIQFDTTLGLGATRHTVLDGNLLVLSEGGAEDVYEFDDDATSVVAHIAVDIGANRAATVANLTTEINTNGTLGWKAIDVSAGASYIVRLIAADGTGRIAPMIGACSNRWQNARIPSAYRISILKSIAMAINLQAIGHYSNATGAPFNSIPFTTFAWDLFDMQWDPYGIKQVSAAGGQSNGGFRAVRFDPSTAYGENQLAGGGVVANFLLCNFGRERIRRNFHRGSLARMNSEFQREAPGSPTRGNRKQVTSTGAWPYHSMPDRRGGQR